MSETIDASMGLTPSQIAAITAILVGKAVGFMLIEGGDEFYPATVTLMTKSGKRISVDIHQNGRIVPQED